MPSGVVARKVYGATGGTLLGAVTSDLILGLLDDHWFDPSTPGSVPTYITAFLVVVINGGFALAGGYITKRGWDEVAAVDTRPVRPVEPEYGEGH